MINPNLGALALVLAASALLAGCEVSIGGKEVPKATVEEQTMKMITAQIGEPSPVITCPGNLKGVVGTVMVCSAPMGEKGADVTLTVTGVEGSDIKWNFKNTPKI
jgi:hypothetical protein